jgi:predicted Rossmann fold flavoprotein
VVVVCGGGASGVVCAIALARVKKRVLVLEKSHRVGRKILVSGNGRCNIANRDFSIERFYSNSLDALKKMLKDFGYRDVERFFNSLGIELVTESGGKVYPMGFNASGVLELLLFEMERVGVSIEYETRVVSIRAFGSRFIVEIEKGGVKTDIEAEKVVVATGSMAMPKVGGCGDGIELAKSLGHKIHTPLPALVQLVSDSGWISHLAGLKIDTSLSLLSNGQKITERRGDTLFTKYGVSGLAVLDISRDVSISLKRGERVSLSIDTFPNMDRDRLIGFLLRRVDRERGLPLELWLKGVMDRKLAKIIKMKSPKVYREIDLNRKKVSQIAYILKNLKLEIKRTRGFEYAEVAIGGVGIDEINPKTFESKKIKGIFIIGELLDVTGDRGGFNLHFAWMSGLKCARAIAGLC